MSDEILMYTMKGILSELKRTDLERFTKIRDRTDALYALWDKDKMSDPDVDGELMVVGMMMIVDGKLPLGD